ncbi:MAG: septum formation initiator family protein, partial [Micromonospora sp.]
MQQRRTPGGQRPARRPGQPGRSGGTRARSSVREGGVRAEPRGTTGRAAAP